MKITEKDIAEYMKLTAKINALEARQKEIRDALKAKGTFSIGRFVVAIVTKSRRQLAGLADVCGVFGIDTVRKAGLIKTVEYETVTVTKKAA
jgi:hypothetical protein